MDHTVRRFWVFQIWRISNEYGTANMAATIRKSTPESESISKTIWKPIISFGKLYESTDSVTTKPLQISLTKTQGLIYD